MAARHPKPRLQPERRPHSRADAVAWDRLLDRVAAGLALVLLVARPLFPSEDADTGSGLVLVALWGVVACLWVSAQAVRGRLRCFVHWIDVGPAILLGAIAVSAVRADTPRPAMNMACEWVGLILSYFLIRQLFRSPLSQRIAVFAMLAVAIALAAYGIYQVFWGFDAQRAEYARNRLRILQDLEILPDSPQESLFINRLNSHEPFATFALANSLAGFLVAWLPIALVWTLSPLPDQRTLAAPLNGERSGLALRRIVPVALARGIVALMIAVGLILTQSRTAYVGVLVQLVMLSALFARTLLARLRKHVTSAKMAGIGLAAAAIIAAVIFLAWRRGKIDEMVFTQAAKSFGYRLQYWQGTIQLIRERLWTGTGPGNFRGHYLRFKLAESSEEIADPHNMVLELIATSGIVAGAALVGSLVAGLAIIAFRQPAPATPASPVRFIDLWPLGLAAFVVAATVSSIGPWTYVWLFAMWSLSAALIVVGASSLEFDARVAAISIVGIAIHFLGAGGIGMPGVSQSLWAMLALGVNASHERREPCTCPGTNTARAAALCVLVAWVWFVLGVLRPVTASVSAVTLGRRLLAARDRAGAEVQFRQAAAQDPLWFEPWLELARIHYERSQASRGRTSEEQFDHAIAALGEAQRLAASRLEPVRILAGLYEARAAHNPAFWVNAADAYRRCVAMYPTSALLHARWAHALWQSGQTDQARDIARRARQLDAQTPHADRKLTDADRQLIDPLQASQSPVE
jgi:hypothetical protein